MLGYAIIVSKLDANHRYEQGKIDDEDRDKTASNSLHAFFRSFRLPFELRNTTGRFQRTANVFFCKLNGNLL